MKSRCLPSLTTGMRRRPIQVRPLRLSASSSWICDRRSFASSFEDSRQASTKAHLRSLSTATAASSSKATTSTTSFATAMRNMVKPFFLKCHPDVQTSPSAKEVNLVAIQNLNAFLQTVEATLKPGAKLQRNEQVLYQVDFCVVLEERIRGKKEEILARRTVELTLPMKILQELHNGTTTSNNNKDMHSQRQQVQAHVEHQLARLLHVAGLQASPSQLVPDEETTLEDQVNQSWAAFLKDGDFGRLDPAKIQLARKQKYERNREAFCSRVDWKRHHEIHQESLRDAEAHNITDGLIRNDPQRRTAHLAEILAQVRVQEEREGEEEHEGVDPLMQLVALRRLSLLLDELFDELQLEHMARMWENTILILTPARSYNTSPSALYRRRKRKTNGDVMAKEGFKIALHANDSVTIHIPVDFRDEELMAHLKRHVNDYQSMLELGREDIFPRTTFDDMDITIG